jgi:hypothetical protein
MRKTIHWLAVLALVGVLGYGCGKEEMQKLRSENEELKQRVATLEKEISKLKETAEFHYQQGIDLLKDSNYEEAKVELEAVIEKYPVSSLVSSAKQQLETVNREIKRLEAEKIAEEKRRIEEQQYQPKSEEEAIAEWDYFRAEPDKYKGTVTTWNLKVSGIHGIVVQALGMVGTVDYVHCYCFPEGRRGMYGPAREGTVQVFGPSGYSPGQPIKNQKSLFGYRELVSLGKAPKVSKNDWIVVTGEFIGVSEDGEIIMKAIRIKNEGYKGG